MSKQTNMEVRRSTERDLQLRQRSGEELVDEVTTDGVEGRGWFLNYKNIPPFLCVSPERLSSFVL